MEYKIDISTAEENHNNLMVVKEYWFLGPEKTSVIPDENKEYWSGLADRFNVSEDIARNRFCANCEYFNNTSDMQQQMKIIPLDQYDMDGGGRGYCHKFDFICHNLRTCQAWEEKCFNLDDKDMDPEEKMKKAYLATDKDGERLMKNPKYAMMVNTKMKGGD